jgi:MFS family permease
VAKRVKQFFLPTEVEQALLGRFYLSSIISESFNVILPFQFVFLLFVLDQPSWATVPLLVEAAVVFCCEIPTGYIADRFGRKIATLTGDSLSGIAWLLVPITTVTSGYSQLLVACIAFAIEGLGQTLVSGSEEAWVIDNLIADDRQDLSDQYFAREKSLSSVGGIFAAITVWLILLFAEINIWLINSLWLVTAIGQLLSVYVLRNVPEKVISPVERETGELTGALPKSRHEVKQALFKIWTFKPLLAFFIVTLIVSYATSVTGDAFEISLIFRGLNPRELAPLEIATDFIGIIAPPLGPYFGQKIRRSQNPVVPASYTSSSLSCLLFAPPLTRDYCFVFIYQSCRRYLGPHR